jgi:hypothetical protein
MLFRLMSKHEKQIPRRAKSKGALCRNDTIFRNGLFVMRLMPGMPRSLKHAGVLPARRVGKFHLPTLLLRYRVGSAFGKRGLPTLQKL